MDCKNYEKNRSTLNLIYFNKNLVGETRAKDLKVGCQVKCLLFALA